jgi:hypothetical protein
LDPWSPDLRNASAAWRRANGMSVMFRGAEKKLTWGDESWFLVAKWG